MTDLCQAGGHEPNDPTHHHLSGPHLLIEPRLIGSDVPPAGWAHTRVAFETTCARCGEMLLYGVAGWSDEELVEFGAVPLTRDVALARLSGDDLRARAVVDPGDAVREADDIAACFPGDTVVEAARDAIRQGATS